ncbi:MAG: CDGSH iron-sulfur domain-containing protein [Candidatus Thermoplasmatota archaeon]|jgi:CDGSH-type Zn-finger protein|nr:CDGSH iron-sulfur domain-containing protein [Ferroplasma sp. Type II]EQB70302.1 MAG: hypothetical protein AMDU4_FER2C00247G0017 [Ferroplasma sp. Type II]MCL4311566.1 CDGSH iron-sulfur domain-containing protein [Candidatus Thermoplasmatota archaeon]HII82173.1 CDGSH iron-sulfur domain-containing protein [Ferroplasma sp.]
MSRVVMHESDKPYLIKVGDKELHLCACGLSENKPYCDGHHMKTTDEGSKLYVYDHNGNRIEISSFYKKE